MLPVRTTSTPQTIALGFGCHPFRRSLSTHRHKPWPPPLTPSLRKRNALFSTFHASSSSSVHTQDELDKPTPSPSPSPSTPPPPETNHKQTHPTPLLTPEQAQQLTQLHVGNVYALDIVDSPSALASGLATDVTGGTDSTTQLDRAALYGTNTVAPPPSATFLQLLAEALDDFTVKILLGAGTASLGLEFWIAGQDGSSPNWIEGVSILAAVAVVTLVTAGNNYQKERQFRALQEVQNVGNMVRAVRSGREVQLKASDVLVGDVVLVETGDILCADGVLISGIDIKVDESHLTGEADDVSKDGATSQAMYSGSKVVSGFGRMIITSVGKRSQSGSIAEMIAVAGGGGTSTGSSGSTSTTDALALPVQGMSKLREETALQRKLAGYAATIGEVGLGAATLATAALTTRFTYDTFFIAHNPWDWSYMHEYLNFFITGVTILVVAVPEGLPLAVTISLAYSVMKMLEENNLVRHLGAAETMATATVICTDKTGTLTQNKMAVHKLWVAGGEVEGVGEVVSRVGPQAVKASFSSLSSLEMLESGDGMLSLAQEEEEGEAEEKGRKLQELGGDGSGLWMRTFDDDEEEDVSKDPTATKATGEVLRNQLTSRIDPGIIDLLCQGISLNSTANVFVDALGRVQETGNRTEIALLQLVQALGRHPPTTTTTTTTTTTAAAAAVGMQVVAQSPFTSDRKRMSTVVYMNSEEDVGVEGRVFTKGAAEIVLGMCRWQLNRHGDRVPLSEEDKIRLLEGFCNFGGSGNGGGGGGGGLRMLCLAYRDVSGEEMKSCLTLVDGSGTGGTEDTKVAKRQQHSEVRWGGDVCEIDQLERDLTLISLVGMQDPLRPEASGAIATCQRAGIEVKMLTGDNATTAAQIARQCGILNGEDEYYYDDKDNTNEYSSNGAAVMEGKEFRELVVGEDGEIRSEAFLDIWPRLRVLARCTPADKFIIVTAVRSLTTDRVAMTGDGTNDAPALRAADVGFAMNSGTQVAKDAADIVLLDDNFSSIVVAALWGRNVYANVARFLQFQLTINIVAVVLAVGGALGVAESPLSAVQMLWVNLIMDSLASLSLATEMPNPSLLDLPPYTESHQFLDIRGSMFKHIIGQAVYQLLALTWLLVAAPAALGVPPHIPGAGPTLHHTLVFNAFVMMQLFNQVNSRKISDRENIGQGLSTATLFLAVLGTEALLQGGIVQWGGEAFSTVPLNAEEWALCVGFGAAGLLVREVMRRVPTLDGGDGDGDGDGNSRRSGGGVFFSPLNDDDE